MKNISQKNKITVRVERDWEYPDLFRQSPSHSGKWNNVLFTEENIKECDFLIVLNRPKKRIKGICPSGNKWLFIQEPPVADYEWLTNSYEYFDRVYTFGLDKQSKKYPSGQTALPWHINKTYHELIKLEPKKKDKKNSVSWITSNSLTKPGHVLRMGFKDFLIENKFKFDLFGRGFQPIEDKFDAIYPYKYSIAIENYHTNDYWTEKISDCFLSWTMPIYYGCKNVLDYFPKESMILIDPHEPEQAIKKIKDAIKNNLWKKNIKYIEEARNLVLNEYQFFPWISKLVNESVKNNKKFSYENFVIPANLPPGSSIFDLIKNKLKI